MAAGEGMMREGRHIHLYTTEQAQGFNTSHTINQLSFGDPFPGMKPNPLDRSSRIIDEGGWGPWLHVLGATFAAQRLCRERK